MFKQMKKLGTAALAVPATALVAFPAFAADVDYTSIITDVDFGGIATAILAVAALLAGIYAASRGARIVLGFLRG